MESWLRSIGRNLPGIAAVYDLRLSRGMLQEIIYRVSEAIAPIYESRFLDPRVDFSTYLLRLVAKIDLGKFGFVVLASHSLIFR